MIAFVQAIRGALRTCAAGVADMLLPDVCLGCGADDAAAEGLCAACNVRLLSLVAMGYCPRCGSTLGPNIPVYEDGCSGCPDLLPRFERVVRLGPYAHPLRRAVLGLKFHHSEAARRHLGAMLAERVAAGLPGRRFDVVLPVPMHWRRRFARGRDHARLLAADLGGRLGVPLGDELVRVRHTPPQTHLPRTRRLANVKGAFGVCRARSIEGADVLLVDDVTTTGATAGEAARTLLAAGAGHVVLAVVAKTEPPSAYAEYVQAGT